MFFKQMERKEGEVPLGFLDTMRKIIREEGPKALFNGGLTRVLRVSPQFGKLKLACTLSELASGVWGGSLKTNLTAVFRSCKR
jgi:hypothetical protein